MISQINKHLSRSEDGQAMVEYALIMGLIVIAAAVSFDGVANKVIEIYQYILTKVNSVL
ncbi:hypothetical protein [Petroclostridium sp. X23]|uniref:Flp family type IVb pilin n=1 Tax=Petroclostridium sp. X23 TaxID=3045146 RepID=UPI0024AD0AE9|nr:hypothetical protein [Petroclostridium sp. X23]WHH57936.1 hypothetical protein QKW49_19305 [Petroclostridium sp. X23]